ncbi:MAG: hypothetical protein H7338_04910 [Candidatus Sericytochromatia bacterium]|nr:hypothetical protein [Candidatus Sericytochromatia bacterium]
MPRDQIPLAGYIKHQQGAAKCIATVGRQRFHMADAQAFAVPQGWVVMAQLQVSADETLIPAGFHLDPAGNLVGMLVDPPVLERVPAEAAADLAHLPKNMPWERSYLTALHHSFARHRIGVGEGLRVLPGMRFTCQGRGDCCNTGRWPIEVTSNQWLALAKATEFADDLPKWQNAAHEMPSFAFGDGVAAGRHHALAPGCGTSTCHQLGSDGGCQLHAYFGWQPVETCDIYPVRAIRTPDGYDVTLSYTCESVCRNQGELLRNQAASLRQRLWAKQFRGAEVAEHLPVSLGSEATLPWAVYRDWEGILLDRLMEMPDRGDAPLKAGSLQLKEWLGEALAGPEWQSREILHHVCATVPDSEAASLPETRLQAWQGLELHPVTFSGDWEMLSRYLRTVLFRKHGLYGNHRSIALPWATTLLAYRLVTAYTVWHAGQEHRLAINEGDLIAAIKATEQMLAHRQTLARMSETVPNPLESYASWLALIG